jgi:hypothetical protein
MMEKLTSLSKAGAYAIGKQKEALWETGLVVETLYASEESKITSPIEKIFYLGLLTISEIMGVSNEISIQPQKRIGKYRVDFLLEQENCNNPSRPRVIVECDGHNFHEKTKEQAASDKQRDRFFARNGYILLRFT